MEKTVINQRTVNYDGNEVQRIFDEVANRSFFRDVTDSEYEALPTEVKNNGDLYLFHDEE
jgi:hypothetical protein